MSEPSQPTVYAPPIPAQRTTFEHPMHPDMHLRYADAGAVPEEPYAHWGLRVAASLIDAALLLPFVVPVIVGIVILADATEIVIADDNTITSVTTSDGTWAGLTVAGVGYLAMLIFGFWNGIVRQGRYGASIGKSCMNLMVVSEADGRPIGAMMTFVRRLLHLVDAIPLYLGYLWPLWDTKRQTFADMIMKTAVLHLAPQEPVHVPQQASAPYGV